VNRLAIASPRALGLLALTAAAVIVALGIRAPSPSRPATVPVVVAPPPAPAPAIVAPPISPITPCHALDLDGDGIADELDEVPASCGTGGCKYRVTLSRTHRHVGDIAGHCPIESEPHKGGGPADILATWDMGATESWVTRYQYVRGRYREHSESHCYRDACTAEHLIRH
jgi:hypothetical protein